MLPSDYFIKSAHFYTPNLATRHTMLRCTDATQIAWYLCIPHTSGTSRSTSIFIYWFVRFQQRRVKWPPIPLCIAVLATTYVAVLVLLCTFTPTHSCERTESTVCHIQVIFVRSGYYLIRWTSLVRFGASF